ncbi:MAG: type I 3-dehydroquinate dehydratase [Candidatus Gracilibacteria bacterium]
MKNIIIYGMRGTGKSTIGKELAIKLDKKFIDLDSFIEKKVGEKLSNYIEKNGWDKFRDTEFECLKEVLEKEKDIVLSLGGGTIIFERNQKLVLKNNSKLIYVYSELKDIVSRIESDENNGNTRNSLTGKSILDELIEVYEKRKDIYERFYDIKIENNSKIEDCINTIMKKINYGTVCIPIINFDDIGEQINIINNSNKVKYVELRIDFLQDLNLLERIIPMINKQIILTNRTSREGGKFIGNSSDSKKILSKYSKVGINYVDFELCNAEEIEILKDNLGDTKLIISHHDFEKTPNLEELKSVLTDMSKYNPDVYKIAVMPKNPDDIQIIYDLRDYFVDNYPGKDFIFISMGELGMQTRIDIPKKLGLLTFGSLNDVSAPGQINYSNLYNLIFN